MPSSVGRVALEALRECLTCRKSPDQDNSIISWHTTDWELQAIDGVLETLGQCLSHGSGGNNAVSTALDEASGRLAHHR